MSVDATDDKRKGQKTKNQKVIEKMFKIAVSISGANAKNWSRDKEYKLWTMASDNDVFGEKEVYAFETEEKADQIKSGFETAFGNQLWACVRRKGV